MAIYSQNKALWVDKVQLKMKKLQKSRKSQPVCQIPNIRNPAIKIDSPKFETPACVFLLPSMLMIRFKLEKPTLISTK